jgi:UDP-hydrolysing UDP-N-acetyl-D-glucosamine 2-epimerase
LRTISVVTVGRSDYGIYLPILRRLQSDPAIRLRLMVTGSHLSPEFDSTVRIIETDGFAIDERLEMLLSADSPASIGKSIGLGVISFSQAFAKFQPDVLLVLGDRFEMFAAALAALPFLIPVAHIHGGEVTVGAIDDALRHSITKLSHLHFVSTADHGRRVEQLGEARERIIVSGAPSLDNLKNVSLMSRQQFEARYGVSLHSAPLLVTFHSVTLEYYEAGNQTIELLNALSDVMLEFQIPVVFTQPNADTGGRTIGRMIEEFVRGQDLAYSIANLGLDGYFSLMNLAAAMVGNSSSGIIEAPSFGLPVVNIGSRQTGRVRAANVIDVEPNRAAITAAIRRAIDPTFRAQLRGIANPYGQGNAATIIVEQLKSISLGPSLTSKVFNDLPAAIMDRSITKTRHR